MDAFEKRELSKAFVAKMHDDCKVDLLLAGATLMLEKKPPVELALATACLEVARVVLVKEEFSKELIETCPEPIIKDFIGSYASMGLKGAFAYALHGFEKNPSPFGARAIYMLGMALGACFEEEGISLKDFIPIEKGED